MPEPVAANLLFLSARPVRAATIHQGLYAPSGSCFYPRDPCGPRHAAAARGRRFPRGFYPRDPCGPRLSSRSICWVRLSFLSARPVRAATPDGCDDRRGARCFYPRDPCGPRRLAIGRRRTLAPVSIRATRAGRDTRSSRPTSTAASFYPRDPCGPRHESFSSMLSSQRMFLSARPVRAATPYPPYPEPRAPVSIRATRAGRDSSRFDISQNTISFYPRDPCGPRPACLLAQPLS